MSLWSQPCRMRWQCFGCVVVMRVLQTVFLNQCPRVVHHLHNSICKPQLDELFTIASEERSQPKDKNPDLAYISRSLSCCRWLCQCQEQLQLCAAVVSSVHEVLSIYQRTTFWIISFLIFLCKHKQIQTKYQENQEEIFKSVDIFFKKKLYNTK